MADDTSAQEARRLRDVYAEYERGRSRLWAIDTPAMAVIQRECDEVVDAMLREIAGDAIGSLDILDLGCGAGRDLHRLAEVGATPGRLHGVDLLAPRVAAARAADPRLNVLLGSGERLPYRDGRFDVVLMFTIMSSILSDAMSAGVAAEARRVLRPGGAILWYDMRYGNPRNRNIRAVGKRQLRGYFPGFALELRSVTVAPPLVRLLGGAGPPAYPLLRRLPPIRSHMIGLLRKPAGGPAA